MSKIDELRAVAGAYVKRYSGKVTPDTIPSTEVRPACTRSREDSADVRSGSGFFDDPIPARKVTLTPLKPATRSASKIGGTPNWIHAPEIPHCARCRKPMAFLTQLESIPQLSFVDEGTLYTFVCARCKVSASLVQSH